MARIPLSKVVVADGPRERLRAVGAEALSDEALLAVVLGAGVRGQPVRALAKTLLGGGIHALSQASPDELSGRAGIGPAKAARVCAALELGRRSAYRRLEPGVAIRHPADVEAHFRPRLAHARVEEFHAILLDARHRVRRCVLLSRGTLTASLVHPREVFAPALRESAAALVVVHNHPSGDPSPSDEDRALTKRLIEAGELLGIPILDHVIVADGGFVSLREAGDWGH